MITNSFFLHGKKKGGKVKGVREGAYGKVPPQQIGGARKLLPRVKEPALYWWKDDPKKKQIWLEAEELHGGCLRIMNE